MANPFLGKAIDTEGKGERKSTTKKLLRSSPLQELQKVSTWQSNILGLDQVPRRYRYGANFQPQMLKKDKESNSQDTSEENSADDENDNALVNKVPSEEQLAKVFESEKRRYKMEAPYWWTYVWEKPKVDESLTRLLSSLTKVRYFHSPVFMSID